LADLQCLLSTASALPVGLVPTELERRKAEDAIQAIEQIMETANQIGRRLADIEQRLESRRRELLRKPAWLYFLKDLIGLGRQDDDDSENGGGSAAAKDDGATTNKGTRR
jgi:hypothetical protein